MAKEKIENVESVETTEVVTVEEKKTFKQKMEDRRQAKKADKIRVHELKADLMKNPENPDDRRKELKEIRKRQLKRAVVPAAIVTTAVVGTVITVAMNGGADEDVIDDVPAEKNSAE